MVCREWCKYCCFLFLLAVRDSLQPSKTNKQTNKQTNKKQKQKQMTDRGLNALSLLTACHSPPPGPPYTCSLAHVSTACKLTLRQHQRDWSEPAHLVLPPSSSPHSCSRQRPPPALDSCCTPPHKGTVLHLTRRGDQGLVLCPQPTKWVGL